ALAGATNALLAIAEQAARGRLIVALSGVEELRTRHLRECDALLGPPAAQETAAELSAMCDELAHLAEALSVLGDLTPRSLDAIAAHGELLSAALAHAAFRARDVIATDDRHMRAAPRTEEIARQARERVLPAVRDGRVPLLGGFIGRSPQGVTTTIGRGGGDLSASLLGAALGADAIEIWTDVDGMLTADPRVVPGARPIEEIRFDEAAELASFGAKVLHPSTIAPAVQRGIPVFVLNARRPEGKGTRITSDAPRRAVTAVAGKGRAIVVKVQTPRMLEAHGVARAIFEVFERHRTAVDVVATSEVSVSLTTDDAAHLDDIIVELRALGDVSIARGRAILALVGAGLGDHARTMARALGAIGDITVHMVSLSASGINLTLVVDESALDRAMTAMHAEFFGEGRAA
ncbi:MAG TPA: aspartate kinase, partial [Gemmatimonadaceae bacterium]|nr:aspartate kinase [Gemmatimonadaceae bacterium]